jgi:hypothetical protein
MVNNDKKTQNHFDSKIRVDVETLARIEFSDIDYLLEKINNKKVEPRMERILYESIISKISSIFQLAMRAYEFLEQPGLKKDLINAFDKTENTSTGKIGKYRADLFHCGIHFLEKTIFYPFGKIEGRGFKGIQIKKGARFNVINVWLFNSNNSEYTITSEGVFEIKNLGTSEEEWILINEFPTVSAINYDEIIKVIFESVKELKIVWFNISQTMKGGGENQERQFFNENGKCELLENDNGKITSYSIPMPIIIEGDLTISPPAPARILSRGDTN